MGERRNQVLERLRDDRMRDGRIMRRCSGRIEEKFAGAANEQMDSEACQRQTERLRDGETE